MAALTRDRNTPRKEGQITAYGVAAGAKIFAGSLVCLNAAGYAAPAADTAGFRFAGVAKQYVDNTAGANGEQVIEVWVDGRFPFDAAAMAVTDIGIPVFVSDDQTVAKATANGVGCGIIAEVESATKVWLDISRLRAQTQASVAAANAVAAAASPPTKAEFDAVVTLVNECKSVINGLLNKLKAGSIIGS
ncbi:MAG: hypothetical protein M1379_00890 [Firmicutes bacterium]|nr:hypothetical protein [Bacillota bacterium]